MSQVRFQVLFGPASLHPQRMGWPLRAGSDDPSADGDGLAWWVGGHWYGWRLMGANNRELGRSALSFVSYPLARRAIVQLRQGIGRLVQHSTTDPATGRWGWRFDLDGTAVAVSGRWYERDHDGRLGAAKFAALTAAAELAEGVVTLHERRGPTVARIRAGGGA